MVLSVDRVIESSFMSVPSVVRVAAVPWATATLVFAVPLMTKFVNALSSVVALASVRARIGL